MRSRRRIQSESGTTAESTFSQIHGSPQGCRLVQSLLELESGVRVEHDPGASLKIDDPLSIDLLRGNDDRSQCQCDVGSPTKTDRTNASGVGPTAGWVPPHR